MAIDFKVKDVIHKIVAKFVPASLAEGTAYRLVIYTQTPARASGHLLKKMREMKSDFTLTAQ